MADAVLGARKTHHFVRGDGVYVKAALVVAAYGVQQFGQVPQAVLPVFVVFGGIDQRLFDVVGRGKIRRSHA